MVEEPVGYSAESPTELSSYGGSRVPPRDDSEAQDAGNAGSVSDDVLEAAEEPDAVARAIDRGFSRVMRAMDDHRSEDRFRESQIDRLHAELQGHKADLVAKAVQPALRAMIRLHDNLSKVLEALAAEDAAGLSPQRLVGLMEEFRDDVELALNHNGVTTFWGTAEAFDPQRQTVLRPVPTADPDLVGRVVAALRPGFEFGEIILQKERVAAHVLTPPTSTEGAKR